MPRRVTKVWFSGSLTRIHAQGRTAWFRLAQRSCSFPRFAWESSSFTAHYPCITHRQSRFLRDAQASSLDKASHKDAKQKHCGMGQQERGSPCLGDEGQDCDNPRLEQEPYKGFLSSEAHIREGTAISRDSDYFSPALWLRRDLQRGKPRYKVPLPPPFPTTALLVNTPSTYLIS